MGVSILECSRCHGRFNYEWSWGAAPGSFRLGDTDVFRCPMCKALGSFDLANEGRDATLPTYTDLQAGVGRRLWGLMLGPFLGLLVVSAVLGVTLTASPYLPLFLMAPPLAGMGWALVYFFYLKKRLAPTKGYLGVERRGDAVHG